MAYVKTGYVHLINSASKTLTCSDVAFDTIRGGVGAYLEKALDKILDKHDRRPGKFRVTSTLDSVFNSFASGGRDLEDLSKEIAEAVIEAKYEECIHENSMLFVLEGPDSIYVLDINRQPHYILNSSVVDGQQKNTIYEEELALPAFRTDKVRFFEVCLKTLEINTLEKLVSTEKEDFYLLADVILKADMDHSLNKYVNDARKAFYTTVINKKNVIAGLEDFKTKKDVNLLNTFEENMQRNLSINKEIDFQEIAHSVFYSDTARRNRFLDLLEGYSITKPIKTLSYKPIVLKTAEYKPKRVQLKNGVEVFVPENVEELNIKLKEVDGEIKEVE